MGEELPPAPETEEAFIAKPFLADKVSGPVLTYVMGQSGMTQCGRTVWEDKDTVLTRDM